MVIEYAPLEDELGDVVEKAMLRAGLTEDALAREVGLEPSRLRDAIDYRYDLKPEEICRLAQRLRLNEVGLSALAQGRYPLPAIAGLGCCLYPLRMPHGIGVANAYLVAECGNETGVLFDAGVDYPLLKRVWPKSIRRLGAVFITHAETEHVGGLAGVLKEFGSVPVFVPEKCRLAGATPMGEGEKQRSEDFEIEALATPGHAEAHNCYLVRSRLAKMAAPILVSGDLLFAGSTGRAYFCSQRLATHLHRVMENLPEATVVAPGHGPLTTIKNERTYNPFVL